IKTEMGAALGRLIATQALACVVDLSELGSGAARRKFMAAFAEALYDANEEPQHLVFDEADLWAPQRPLPDQTGLLGHIEEIVRRGRVRGFIPWLITQRPAVVHKDVLSVAVAKPVNFAPLSRVSIAKCDDAGILHRCL